MCAEHRDRTASEQAMFKTEGEKREEMGMVCDQQHQQQHGKAVGNENYGFIFPIKLHLDSAIGEWENEENEVNYGGSNGRKKNNLHLVK